MQDVQSEVCGVCGVLWVGGGGGMIIFLMYFVCTVCSAVSLIVELSNCRTVATLLCLGTYLSTFIVRTNAKLKHQCVCLLY